MAKRTLKSLFNTIDFVCQFLLSSSNVLHFLDTFYFVSLLSELKHGNITNFILIFPFYTLFIRTIISFEFHHISSGDTNILIEKSRTLPKAARYCFYISTSFILSLLIISVISPFLVFHLNFSLAIWFILIICSFFPGKIFSLFLIYRDNGIITPYLKGHSIRREFGALF